MSGSNIGSSLGNFSTPPPSDPHASQRAKSKRCATCFEKLEEGSQDSTIHYFACDHFFHNECLEQLKQCPVCGSHSPTSSSTVDEDVPIIKKKRRPPRDLPPPPGRLNRPPQRPSTARRVEFAKTEEQLAWEARYLDKDGRRHLELVNPKLLLVILAVTALAFILTKMLPKE